MAPRLQLYSEETDLCRTLYLTIAVNEADRVAQLWASEVTSEGETSSITVRSELALLPSEACELLHELIGSGTPALDGASD